MHNLLVKNKHDVLYDSEESIEGWLSFLKDVDRQSHKQMQKTWDGLKAKRGGTSLSPPNSS